MLAYLNFAQDQLVATLGDDAKSAEMRDLVNEIAAQSDKVTARFDGQDARRPSFAIRADEGRAEAVFAAFRRSGHEFTLSLRHAAGGHPPKEDAELLDAVRALEGKISAGNPSEGQELP
ncbi:MAG: hypothetical protein U5M50_11510 [Sphingobium sp.]|nr:hypothetical protein [Sphingobium sp.]